MWKCRSDLKCEEDSKVKTKASGNVEGERKEKQDSYSRAGLYVRYVRSQRRKDLKKGNAQANPSKLDCKHNAVTRKGRQGLVCQERR